MVRFGLHKSAWTRAIRRSRHPFPRANRNELREDSEVGKSGSECIRESIRDNWPYVL